MFEYRHLEVHMLCIAVVAWVVSVLQVSLSYAMYVADSRQLMLYVEIEDSLVLGEHTRV
ncbi:hypothetical protein SERLA73DRAFT_138129 [Serpula lacrymans var. lacrymans S7.3]|uniref:Uncharacterized protein n=1 Tax=Serpula lacrymans var. lacrymans (strain S7.3) TaxID=936435 RepID=F8Q0W1_SERL3|nr:hypothetical protein SERLA73DRAFT_138129 [Serpula lacrymans var. lacrymans S7.3]